MNNNDTIIALATSLGNSAISIIRISGDNAHSIVNSVFCSSSLDKSNITYRYMHLGTLSCNSINDKCFAVYFNSPFSYTGEDMVELQCHGGAKLADCIIRELLLLGCRLATNGEFTKRAFLNGKVSLSQAEGIIDMINAESSAALAASYRMMKGNIGDSIKSLRYKLIDVMANLEASFDYPDEMEDEATANAASLISDIIAETSTLLSTAAIGGYIHKGINVAIIGAPNAGKSSLLNTLIGQDRAIVTDIAGTTRDTIEAKLEYKSLLFNFIDTAGIRESSDIIEKIGIDKSIYAASNCDVAILLADVSCETLADDITKMIGIIGNKPYVVAYNKCDLVSTAMTDGIMISAKKNVNINSLLDMVIAKLDINLTDTSQDIITSARHIDCLTQSRQLLEELNHKFHNLPIECILIDLHRVFDLFGEINGESAKEDIIDRIFSKFCLGK